MAGRLVLCEVVDGGERAVFYERSAARYLRMDVNRFRQLVRSGEIPARRRSKLRIFLKHDLDQWLLGLPVVNRTE